MCLLKQGDFPNSLWVRAVDVVFFLTNRFVIGSLPPLRFLLRCYTVISLTCQNGKLFCSAFWFLLKGVSLKAVEISSLVMVAFLIPTIFKIQLHLRRVSREMCHLTKKALALKRYSWSLWVPSGAQKSFSFWRKASRVIKTVTVSCWKWWFTYARIFIYAKFFDFKFKWRSSDGIPHTRWLSC